MVDTPAIGMAVPLARMVNGMLVKLDAILPSTKAQRVQSGRLAVATVLSGPSPKLPP